MDIPRDGGERLRVWPGAVDNALDVLSTDAGRRQAVLRIVEPRRAYVDRVRIREGRVTREQMEAFVRESGGRVLRPRGRMLFTDAMIVTGLVSQEELAVRSSIGWYFFVPPGENERLIERAGFTLLSSEDVTASAEVIAQQWHAARDQYRDELVAREGETNFAGLQRFLACVHRLSAERRLSRYCYLAEKPA